MREVMSGIINGFIQNYLNQEMLQPDLVLRLSEANDLFTTSLVSSHMNCLGVLV